MTCPLAVVVYANHVHEWDESNQKYTTRGLRTVHKFHKPPFYPKEKNAKHLNPEQASAAQ